MIYGDGPFLGAIGSAIEESRWSCPVTVGGSRSLKPYYDVWLREGKQALLREPYAGIIAE